MDLVLGDERIAMDAAESGWYETDRELEPGTRYAFSLDGGPSRPDPRSPRQPDGVHAASATVDHGEFEWTNPEFVPRALRESVIYELHIGTFTPEGTFDSAIDKLDHLVHLGITHVEVMPVASFPGRWGWGYDGVDLFAPHEPYGGPDGLKRLVDACHSAGLAVILDVVYNHLGPDGNYLPEFGPYFTDRHETPWGAAVNFGEPEVRRYVIDNAVMWLHDYKFDGLRLDAVHAIVDDSPEHVLQEMVRAAKGKTLIAENEWIRPELMRWGIDAQWHDAFHHAVHAALTGERDGYYAEFGSPASLRDTYGPIEPGHPGDYVVFLQNHDQIGNRAQGERIHHLVPIEHAAVGAAAVLQSPYVPLIFQGEEWAAGTPFQYFTDHTDEELGRAVSEGRRREFSAFGWKPEDVPDPQDEATFLRSKLDWSELDKPEHAQVLDLYRTLIAHRR